MSLKNIQKNWHIFGKTKPFETLVIPPKGQEKWDVDAFFATGERQVEELVGYLESLGLELPGDAALDFGCGAGRVTQALAKHFDRCYGIDIAPSLIALAEQYNRCGEKCCYILNETADLRLFPDECIDFVYSYITLQEMAPRYAKMYLEEFIRILAPDGLLVFQMPSKPLTIRKLLRHKLPSPLRHLFYIIKNRGQPWQESHGIRREKVVQLLKKHGGKVIDVKPSKGSPGWLSFQYCVLK